MILMHFVGFLSAIDGNKDEKNHKMQMRKDNPNTNERCSLKNTQVNAMRDFIEQVSEIYPTT